MNITVLTGGDSSEKEISLKSGLAIQKACIELGHNTNMIEIDGNLDKFISQVNKTDFVFIALHGGKGENGVIQGLLNSLNIPYNGANVLASSLGMEKALTKQIAYCIGVKTPGWRTFNNVRAAIEYKPIKFPVVVKPSADGSTLGLTIVESLDEYSNAVSVAEKYDGKILVEEYIHGRELTVTIIGNKAYPIVEIVPTHNLYDYECKYQIGMSEYYCPAKIDDDITELIQADALKIYNTIQCSGYARADFILDRNNIPWFLEINTLPGMTETSLVPKSAKAAGISFNKLIQMIINEAYKS
jgi:D-alanine-D-alanine ligase